MGTENEGFHRRSTRGDLGKSRASSLGSVLRLPTVSMTLQEVGNFSYFGFIPTFELILGWFYVVFMACFMSCLWHFLCHVYGMFCDLNWEDIMAGRKGLFWDGFGSKWSVLELPRSSIACYCVAGL